MANMNGLPLDYLMFEISRHLLYKDYSQIWRMWVKILEIDGMFAQSCCAMGFGVKKTTIEHSMMGMRCIARAQ